jgi:hypothetical protein
MKCRNEGTSAANGACSAKAWILPCSTLGFPRRSRLSGHSTWRTRREPANYTASGKNGQYLSGSSTVTRLAMRLTDRSFSAFSATVEQIAENRIRRGL